ncbi:MAG: hypothetical protein ACREMU_02315 [Gemmatimonadaceae bacterium]
MMSRAPIYLLLGLTLVACEKIGSGGSTSASAPDSISVLSSQLAQARAMSAQQDSLMQGFQQTTQLLADMDKELSKVKGLQSHVPLNVKGENNNDPQSAYRASLLGKVQEVTTLLNKSRARVASLNSKNSTLSSQIASYDSTITNLQAMLEQNKVDLAALNMRVDSLTTANTTLSSTNKANVDTVTDLRKIANTVYYVVGTKDDLKKRGIIVEEGSKFLFFGHKALVPARKLDPSWFTPINKWDDTPITLHIVDKPYKVVSRQDPTLIEEAQGADGKPNGELHVSQPAEFWGPSKYLIIVEGA